MTLTKETLQQLVLNKLDKDGEIKDSGELNIPDQLELLGVLKSLESMEVVQYQPIERDIWTLTEEGELIVKEGSHEVRVFYAIPSGKEGIPIGELQKKLGSIAKVGQGQAFKNKWIGKQGGNLIRLVEKVEDITQKDLLIIQQTKTHPKTDVLNALRRRKLCDKQKLTTYAVKKGKQFTLNISKQATELTAEMLQNGSWKTLSFKKFNFDAEGIPPTCGHLHPLMKVREEFRQIFFEMG
jgi:phenylalanyl-tRNA synthetase alpha chain